MTTPEDNYDKLFEELLRETARVASDFDYDENDIDNNRIALDIKFSLVSNANLSDTIQINVNN